jgi:hypothetical protein
VSAKLFQLLSTKIQPTQSPRVNLSLLGPAELVETEWTTCWEFSALSSEPPDIYFLAAARFLKTRTVLVNMGNAFSESN